MPVHDWSRVDAGIFHDFHLAWCANLTRSLNTGVLPSYCYCLIEPGASEFRLDRGLKHFAADLAGHSESDEKVAYALKRRTLAIRHSSNHHLIALIEMLAPGNKSSQHALYSFLDRATAAFAQGIHLFLIDLHLPGPHDPQGIHGALWERLTGGPYEPPPDKPLTLAAYTAGPVKTAYVEPVAVGDVLPDMPLFLDPEQYVNVPLEATYRAAYAGVPRYYRDILEA